MLKLGVEGAAGRVTLRCWMPRGVWCLHWAPCEPLCTLDVLQWARATFVWSGDTERLGPGGALASDSGLSETWMWSVSVGVGAACSRQLLSDGVRAGMLLDIGWLRQPPVGVG
jgi:hypothetical protein